MNTTRQLIALSLVSLTMFACNKSSGEEASIDQPARTYLAPNKIFTGFSPGAEFLSVLSTNLVDPTFEVEDPSIATVRVVDTPPGFSDTFIELRGLRAGTTRVIARAGDRDIDADIVVTSYSASELNLGNQRYNNPANANGSDRRSCASCHMSEGGADHSPFTIGSFDDEDILQAVETGEYKHRRRLFIAEDVPHAHDLTEAERVGIMAYLRSIRPSVLVAQ